jgi:hypothetical protein
MIKVILHQIWVKKISPIKFNLEYGGTFTKLFMHVSSQNMFPTTRNLQIRVHVYLPRHCRGDWLTFGCFVPMKSQNIWQQIILFSSTLMQMICAWHKIWTLSGRLSLMCNVQLMKKRYIYIPCVPHKNNCPKKLVHMTWNRQIPH